MWAEREPGSLLQVIPAQTALSHSGGKLEYADLSSHIHQVKNAARVEEPNGGV